MPQPEPLPPAFRSGVVERIRAEADRLGLDGLLLLDPANVFYATGFAFSVNERPIGFFVPRRGGTVLFAPLLERENAEGVPASALRVYEEFPGPVHPVLWMIRESGARRLGIDALPASLFLRASALADRLDLTDAVERMRVTKAPEELALVRAAAAYADLCLDAILREAGPIVRGGGTELDILAAGMGAAEARMRSDLGEVFAGTKCGMTGTVHSGPRAALPHGRTGARRPGMGDTLIAGIGASVGGYHAESGATFVLGSMNADQERCLRAAEDTDAAARAALRPGAPCEAVNRAALTVLRDAGLSDFIRHRIGHGMGVAGHEAPWLAPGDETAVASGMVFSNEPGIYRPGLDGYRTINTMIVGKAGIEVPSAFQALVPIDARVIEI